MVCLARSNPAELAIAHINGDAHQQLCHTHIVHANSLCNFSAAINTSTDVFRSRTFQLLEQNAAFRGYCERLSLNQPTFWLEYKDLLCETGKTLNKLQSFFGVQHRPVLGSTKSLKLTKPLNDPQSPSPGSFSPSESLLKWGIHESNSCGGSSCEEVPAFCYSS